jgi:ABC-type lipoprotein release transport system permease subunit
MGTLFGIQNLFTQVGMSIGGIVGAALDKVVGYIWVYNLNAIMLFVLFFLTAYVYPYDPPVVSSAAAAAGAGGKGDITMGMLLKRFDQFSVSMVIFSVLYTYC